MDHHKDLKDVISFSLHLISAGVDALGDGRIDYTDLPKLWGPLQKLSEAVDGIENVMKCVKEMTDEDAREIHAWAAKEFDLKDDMIEMVIESALAISLNILSILSKINKLKKK